jgi:hypothetical protein
MIDQVKLKIFFTVVLFVVGGLFIHYSIDNGNIKATIEPSQVMADAAVVTK